MWECPKPPNKWQYHPWAAHLSTFRLLLILLVPMTWERKKLRMLNKAVARPHAGQWQGIPPPPSVSVLPVNWSTVKPHYECECQELQKMNATWSHQLTSWIWTRWRCQQYKREWGVPWPCGQGIIQPALWEWRGNVCQLGWGCTVFRDWVPYVIHYNLSLTGYGWL